MVEHVGNAADFIHQVYFPGILPSPYASLGNAVDCLTRQVTEGSNAFQKGLIIGIHLAFRDPGLLFCRRSTYRSGIRHGRGLYDLASKALPTEPRGSVETQGDHAYRSGETRSVCKEPSPHGGDPIPARTGKLRHGYVERLCFGQLGELVPHLIRSDGGSSRGVDPRDHRLDALVASELY